jgi:hypothetical protein
LDEEYGDRELIREGGRVLDAYVEARLRWRVAVSDYVQALEAKGRGSATNPADQRDLYRVPRAIVDADYLGDVQLSGAEIDEIVHRARSYLTEFDGLYIALET